MLNLESKKKKKTETETSKSTTSLKKYIFSVDKSTDFIIFYSAHMILILA